MRTTEFSTTPSFVPSRASTLTARVVLGSEAARQAVRTFLLACFHAFGAAFAHMEAAGPSVSDAIVGNVQEIHDAGLWDYRTDGAHFARIPNERLGQELLGYGEVGQPPPGSTLSSKAIPFGTASLHPRSSSGRPGAVKDARFADRCDDEGGR